MRNTNQVTGSRGQRRVLLALLVALAALGLSACAEQPTMILIRGAALLGSDCAPAANPSTFQTEGVLDVTLATSYILAPNIENVAPSSEDVGTKTAGGAAGSKGATFENLGIEGNRVIITDAEISFEALTSGLNAPQSINIPIGGAVVEPGGGKATLMLTILNQEQISQLGGGSGILMAKMRFSGITSSDTEIESNEFSFPITICSGCLVSQSCDTDQSASRCINPGQDVVYCPTAP